MESIVLLVDLQLTEFFILYDVRIAIILKVPLYIAELSQSPRLERSVAGLPDLLEEALSAGALQGTMPLTMMSLDTEVNCLYGISRQW